MSEQAPKRFYEKAEVAPHENGYGVFLDGRLARTMGRQALAAASEALAQAVAEEWAKQGEHIDRNKMPLTAFLSAAIDSDETTMQQWMEETLNYLGSDLLCYRAEKPAALVSRQTEEWDPYLAWFSKEYGAQLNLVTGLIAEEQPQNAIEAVTRELSAQQRESLLGLKTATAITGSAVLALALWKNAFSDDMIFEASRLDERFQEERWGVDAEAKAREEQIKLEFKAVAEFLRLSGNAS